MARHKELTKADKFYLDSHLNNKEDDLPELALAVKNTQDIVREYLVFKRAEQKLNVHAQMGHKERNGQFVATIMTPNASEMADTARNESNKSSKAIDPNMIHQCRPRN